MTPRRYRADVSTRLARPGALRARASGITVTDIPGLGDRPLWWVREHRPDLLRPSGMLAGAAMAGVRTDDLPF
jgi:hypothetical protein